MSDTAIPSFVEKFLDRRVASVEYEPLSALVAEEGLESTADLAYLFCCDSEAAQAGVFTAWRVARNLARVKPWVRAAEPARADPARAHARGTAALRVLPPTPRRRQRVRSERQVSAEDRDAKDRLCAAHKVAQLAAN